MKKSIHLIAPGILLIFILVTGCRKSVNPNDIDENRPEDGIPGPLSLIFNHHCTDISKIPEKWIQQAKEQFRIHFAHTSHGEQIVTGLQRISSASLSNDLYKFVTAYCQVPGSQNSLRMMDGQYMDAISEIEAQFPDVTFIYMTGNAQSEEQNRVSRNNQIREYCQNNNKILFDFADLDCWYNGEQHTVNGIPMEHPHYYGDEAGHTTYESCENKAKAFWWMLARVAGWDGM
jgi:hypothetical protein